MLGGMFSRPADKFPFLDIPLLRQYPYAMPCMISAVISAFGATLAYFLMEEVRRFLSLTFCGALNSRMHKIDSSTKEGASGKTTQEGKVLRICTRCHSCHSVVCPATLCHSVLAVVDHLRIRPLFRFHRL